MSSSKPLATTKGQVYKIGLSALREPCIVGGRLRHRDELPAASDSELLRRRSGRDGHCQPRRASGELLHAGGGLLVLLVAATLSVYKPRGMTPYGWRKQHEQPSNTN